MLGVIINPASGKKAYNRLSKYLGRLLSAEGCTYTLQATCYAGHAIELGREMVERGYDEILVVGGDGTLSEVVNGVMTAQVDEKQRRRVTIGLVPHGTGNDWGRYWLLTRDYKDALRRFLQGQTHPIDIGCLTYWRNGEEKKHYFVNSIGFGVDSLCCAGAADLKYYMGSHAINYFFALLLAIRRQPSMPVELRADGKRIPIDRLYTMNIGNGPYSGGGIRQNPDADPMDGFFHAMVARKPTLREVLRAIPRLFDGRLLALDFIRPFTGRVVEVNAETDYLRIEADGILDYFSGQCRVECIHHAIGFKA